MPIARRSGVRLPPLNAMKSLISLLALLLLMTITVYLQGCASKTSNPDSATGNNTQPAIASKIAKVRLDRAGKIFLNGTRVSFDELKRGLAVVPKDGVVWFYRENPEADPHAEAEAVMEAILEARLSIRLSSKPDYSDVVDPQGLSHTSQ
jgi:biopolymer transport protein ExbD